MHYPLDHILWAVPDLDAGCAAFAGATGVTPGGGGSHDGFGTRNRLASLGRDLFFEVISVDPAQHEFRTRAQRIGQLRAPELHTFGVQGDDLTGFRDIARSFGLATADPIEMGRTRADGVRIRWRAVYTADPRWGDMIPFLIDWMGSEHPWSSTPKGCSIREFCALHPDAGELAEIYAALGVDVPVRRSVAPGFLLRLDTPRGEVVLT
jgi:hypothetical protein